MKTVVVVFWRISAVTTKPSDVRRNRLHSSFAPKQSVCKMSGSAARDKCAVGLTHGLTRNHSSQGLVSQSRVRAIITSRHQALLALRSLQGLSWGGGWGQCFQSFISTRQAFCYWNETKKMGEKIFVRTAWIENSL